MIMILNRQITRQEHRKYFNIGVILVYSVTVGILVTILTGYFHLFNTLHYDSIEVIKYVNIEKCSDGVLAEALK